MPRKQKFNSAWEDSARKTAKSKKRGVGGRFTKGEANNCVMDVQHESWKIEVNNMF
jgi:hypothetical protein